MNMSKIPCLANRNSRGLNIPTISVSRPSCSVSKHPNTANRLHIRSSSAGRNSALRPVALFGLRRSNSYSDISTPQSRLRSSSITPRVISASKYPTNNKDWQHAQFARVKQFFLTLDPEMPSIKPLSLRVFVHTMNLLLREIDHRINITMENYKIDITHWLQLLKFPNQIKPSVIKNPGVPQNWSYIFAIWVWLIDKIEVLRNPGSLLKPPSADCVALQQFEIALLYLTESFNLWNNDFDQTPARQQLKTSIETLRGVNLKDATHVEEQLKCLQSELSDLNTIKESVMIEKFAKIKELNARKAQNNKALGYINNHRQQLLQEKEEHSKKDLHLQNLIQEKKDVVANLKAAVSQQSCSYKQKTALFEDVESLKYLISVKEQELQRKKQQLLDIDYKLADSRQKLQTDVVKINSVVSQLMINRPEMEAVKIRETGFFQDDMIDEVYNFIEKKKLFDERLSQEESEARKQLKKAEISTEEIKLQQEELKKKIADLSNVLAASEDNLELIKQKNKEEINVLELKHRQSCLKLAEMVQHRPNVEEKVSQLEGLKTKKQSLLEEKAKILQKGEEFFASCLSTTTKTIDRQMGLQKKIRQTFENSKSEEITADVLQELINRFRAEDSKN